MEDELSALLDDPDFRSVQRRVSSFNLFEAVGAVRGELRHSNFLGYLLSPRRSHGMGSIPLEKVVRSILEQSVPNERVVSTLALLVGDLDDTVVHRERDNMDLLIEVSALNLVILVENKIGAAAGDGQLARYRQLLEMRYPTHRRLLVFLTPDGRLPEDPEYVPYSYVQLAEVLGNLANEEGVAFGQDAQLIVRHYVEMLRRHVVPDEQLKSLATRLYERHKEAFDFVFENMPRPASLLDIVRGRVENCDGLTIDSATSSSLRFVPERWDAELQNLKGDPTQWTRSGRGILFEAKIYADKPGRVNISLILGPAAAGEREFFYNAARGRSELFSGLVKPMGQKWAAIYSRDLLTAPQARSMAYEAQATNVSLAWSDFQGTVLPDLISAILEIDADLSAMEVSVVDAKADA
jgi:hypothetical protein